jgi:hypothetical protein
MLSRTLSLILITVSIWLGFGIRLHNLDAVPLRGDEAFSAMNWAEMPISQSLSEIATIEPHPPLTYVIFHIWNLIIGGIDSPFALRMLGVLSNLIGIPAMYALSKHLTKNPTISLLAAMIWAVHPFEVWHSQDFRNYALWAGLNVTTLWLGLRLIVNRRAIDWGLYSLFAILTAFIFYTELLTLGAFGLYMLITQRKNKAFLIRLISVQLIIVSAVLMGFIILQGALLGSGGYGGNVEPFYAPDYLTRFLPTLAIGDTLPVELSNLWIPLVGLCMLFITVTYKIYHKITPLILFLIIIPLVLLGFASTRISIFHPRYVLSTVPAVILLISAGSYGLTSTLSKRFSLNQNLTILVIVSPWFIVSVLALNNYFNNPALQKAPAWDELGTFLNANVTADDLVIQLSTDAAFGYYYDGKALDRGLPASPSQPKAEIIDILETARTEYDSLYIVSNAIRDWQNADVVETWASQNMQRVRLSSASGLGIRQYKNWDISETYSNTGITQFDELIALVDYQLYETPLPTGEIVLWLYWRPLSHTATPHKSFVHLIGDINPDTGSPLWSQDDQFPQDGRLDSTSWELNAVYRDVYYLPAESLQNGDYQILVGWYNPETNTRINTEKNTDTFQLTQLSYP